MFREQSNRADKWNLWTFGPEVVVDEVEEAEALEVVLEVNNNLLGETARLIIKLWSASFLSNVSIFWS